LDEAIGATFAGAVKEEDDRPFLVGRPILRQENLIFVSSIMQGKRAIEETGIGLAGKYEGRDGKEHDCCEKNAPTMRDQGSLRKRK
jgi:hypothetical protein